jgi:hypothetical protein
MPTYEFQSEDGHRVERFLRASDPKSRLGSSIRVNGKSYKRVISSNTEVQSDAPEYVSPTLPKGLSGCKVNAKGFTVITGGRKQEREIVRRVYG